VVGNYTAEWPKLDMVPDEIVQVEAALKSQGFHVAKVMRPKSDQLNEAFVKLRAYPRNLRTSGLQVRQP
jgi:hypothetical protein